MKKKLLLIGGIICILYLLLISYPKILGYELYSSISYEIRNTSIPLMFLFFYLLSILFIKNNDTRMKLYQIATIISSIYIIPIFLFYFYNLFNSIISIKIYYIAVSLFSFIFPIILVKTKEEKRYLIYFSFITSVIFIINSFFDYFFEDLLILKISIIIKFVFSIFFSMIFIKNKEEKIFYYILATIFSLLFILYHFTDYIYYIPLEYGFSINIFYMILFLYYIRKDRIKKERNNDKVIEDIINQTEIEKILDITSKLMIQNNYKETIPLLEKAALLGSDKAMFQLANIYSEGKWIEENISKAVEYYQDAAKKNHPDALFELGMCYLNGKGKEKDLQQGEKLLEKAAKLGNKEAYRFLNKIGISIKKVNYRYISTLSATLFIVLSITLFWFLYSLVYSVVVDGYEIGEGGRRYHEQKVWKDFENTHNYKEWSSNKENSEKSFDDYCREVRDEYIYYNCKSSIESIYGYIISRMMYDGSSNLYYEKKREYYERKKGHSSFSFDNMFYNTFEKDHYKEYYYSDHDNIIKTVLYYSIILSIIFAILSTIKIVNIYRKKRYSVKYMFYIFWTIILIIGIIDGIRYNTLYLSYLLSLVFLVGYSICNYFIKTFKRRVEI